MSSSSSSTSSRPITASGLSNYPIGFAPGSSLGGKGPQSKTDAQKLDIERRLNERAKTASEAFRAQNEMHMLAAMQGDQYGGGWYAVLPEGQREYDYGKVFWVNAVNGEDAVSRGFFERFKVESVLGNPAGVFLLFTALVSTLRGVKGGACVTEERLGRQLEDEYGINPYTIGKKIEKSGACEEALRVMQLLQDMSS